MKFKPGLLLFVIIAILLGIGGGFILPSSVIRIFMTFNGIFGAFLSFFVPILILGLVSAGIANLGSRAGRLLLITVLLAFGFTYFSGFFTWGICSLTYPILLKGTVLTQLETNYGAFAPYFVIKLPPILDVLSALVMAFIVGLGTASLSGESQLKVCINEFEQIIHKTIRKVLIPLLPLFIFGIFLEMTAKGQVGDILGVFIKLIALIFVMTITMLLIQFSIAGVVARRNPIRLLINMLPAYFTALGTSSSAATIPITLRQAMKNGVRQPIAEFSIPLCATIHLSGSTMKITACALAIMIMTGMPISPRTFAGFILALGLAMVAAPGVPGGAIMAALGILESILGFGKTEQGLMIALYIAMDSFGTACNITGDGAVACILDRIERKPESDS